MPKTKKALAQAMGIARSTLYYKPKLPARDWSLKIKIEEVLHRFNMYGHRRIADALNMKDERRVLRVMNLFGIKPYRRRGKKPRKPKDENRAPEPYSNLPYKKLPP